MIFVATGTQFPFDRLIQYMDDWAETSDETVFAQIGNGHYQPKHIQWERFMGMDEYNQNIQKASVFVSHAGMGNIISGRDKRTPTIVINRQAKLGEHRNDHQADGIVWMNKLEGIYGISTREELITLLNQRVQLSSSGEECNEPLDKLVNYLDKTLTRWK